jgi:MSHA biogenesis protein MshE
LIEISDDMVDALREGDLRTFSAIAKKKPSYRPLARQALDYAFQGIISLDEVLRLSVELMQD